MSFESAQPKPAEPDAQRSAWVRLGVLASAALPFLLFLHGFGAFVLANRSGPVYGAALLPLLVLAAAVAILVLVPSVLGYATRRVAPGLATALRPVTPLFALGVLVFAFYATWRNVFMILDLYLLNRLS